MRRYGIGARQVVDLVRRQGGVCAICGKQKPEHVDHDHKTNSVRGVLCFNCNGGLGQFRDQPELLLRALEYLEAAETPRNAGSELVDVARARARALRNPAA
jgi:Recombination endonuclease VII